MAIVIDGKVFRNLEEQVRKNQADILYILEEEGVLNQFGVKVVNQVDSDVDLPDPLTYEGEYGDAILVGTTEPYDMYIFTRPFGAELGNQWFNIGQFPLPGPQGIQGLRGEKGEKGDRGEKGEVGPQGIQGPAGQSVIGPQGPQGIQGPIGPKGDPGESFRIVGTLSDVSLLPAPTEETRSSAYLVDINGVNHLYVIVGEEDLTWFDAGPLEGIPGEPGATGPQGPAGATVDVQINGTSIVVDSVANIPYASYTQGGAISIAQQHIRGNKIFENPLDEDSISFAANDNGTIRGRSNFAVNKRGTYLYTILRTINHFIVLGGNGSNDLYKGLWIDTRGGKIAVGKEYDSSSYAPSAWSSLPDYSGTFLSAPENWATDTSGTMTLFTSGLHEFKAEIFDADLVAHRFHWTMYINASSGIQRSSMIWYTGTQYAFIEVDANYTITLYIIDMATSTATAQSGNTLYYRKIGIA